MENRGFVIFLGSTVPELSTLTPVLPPFVAENLSPPDFSSGLDFTYPREVWLLELESEGIRLEGSWWPRWPRRYSILAALRSRGVT